MKLIELFINETTEEDRAIISLARPLYNLIVDKYADVQVEDGKPVTVGKIEDLVDTPLEILNSVKISLYSNQDLLDKFSVEGDSEDQDQEPDEKKTRIIKGFWDPETNEVGLNADYLTYAAIRSTLAHELRHALDDHKSEFRANQSNRYRTPKNKEHRKDYSADPYATSLQKKTPYLAQPGEINARFAQVMAAIMARMEIHVKKGQHTQLRDKALRNLFDLLDKKNIAYLFPEKEKSKDYKRLIKRAVDMIDKEIAYHMSKKDDKVPK